jgi:hypothetical protein
MKSISRWSRKSGMQVDMSLRKILPLYPEGLVATRILDLKGLQVRIYPLKGLQVRIYPLKG